jgi:hypothetical protein
LQIIYDFRVITEQKICPKVDGNKWKYNIKYLEGFLWLKKQIPISEICPLKTLGDLQIVRSSYKRRDEASRFK